MMLSARCNPFWLWLWLGGLTLQAMPLSAKQWLQLRPIGEYVLPSHLFFERMPVGGLSDLAYDPKQAVFYSISDDRSQHAPARFYRITFTLDRQGNIDRKGVNIKSVTLLKDEKNRSYAEGTIDGEGIALSYIGQHRRLFISSEGSRSAVAYIAPFINGYDDSGTLVETLPLPNYFWSGRPQQAPYRGIRDNLSLESLTTTQDAHWLLTANENALYQDGGIADTQQGSPVRILRYDLHNGWLEDSFLYQVEALDAPGASTEALSHAINGLVALETVDNTGTRLLTLERSYVPGIGNHIKLFETHTDQATDISKLDQLADIDNVVPARKRLLLDINKAGFAHIDNIEGMAFGPLLASGERLLLMVSDDNFSGRQHTVFYAFAVRLPTP